MMKKVFFLFIIFLISMFLIASLLLLSFEEKPASLEKIEEILSREYKILEKSNKREQCLEVMNLIEEDKEALLKLFMDENSNENRVVTLNDLENTSNIPMALLKKLKNILIDYHLEITSERKVFLIKITTDYDDYLYIIHKVKKIDSSEVNSTFEYKITIENAFYDIDPNNFVPN